MTPLTSYPTSNSRGGYLGSNFMRSISNRSGPTLVGNEKFRNLPGSAIASPDIGIAEGLGDFEKPLRCDAEELAQLFDIALRRLITARANDRYRLLPRDPAVANF